MSFGLHLDAAFAAMTAPLGELFLLVEQAVAVAVNGLADPSESVREQARVIEERIDALEQQLEQSCQMHMALQAPVAGDLRRLLSIMRIIGELERMGDLAESVARRVRYIARHAHVVCPDDLRALGASTLTAVSEARVAWQHGEVTAVERIFAAERESDRLAKRSYAALRAAILDDPDRLAEYIHLLRAVGRLEHIADLAATVAEEAVFVHHGRSIRHHHERLRQQDDDAGDLPHQPAT